MRKIKLITLFLILFILTLIPLNTVNAEGTKRVMTQIMTDSNGNYFYWPSSLSFPYGVRIKEILQNEIIEAKWTTADGQKVRKYVFDFSFRTDGTIGYYKKYKSKIENSIFTDIISEKPVQETTPLFFEDGYPVEYVMENYHVGSKDKFDIKYNDKISYDYYGTVYYWQHHWIDENTRSRFLANDSYATDLDNSYGESGEIRIEIALIGDEDLTLFDVPSSSCTTILSPSTFLGTSNRVRS